MLIRSVIWIVCFGVLAACNSGDGASPRQECEDTSAALCERLYACYAAGELASVGLPASEAACITMFQELRGCAAQTAANACTGGNQTYHAAAAAKCTEQITGLTCAQIRDPFFDEKTETPACASVCVVD